MFEKTVAEITRPINGQFPRPWMTNLQDPTQANVFIVGRNQKNGYPSDKITHKRHLNALFNRNGESCSSLYLEITGNSPSLTRKNTEKLVAELNKNRVQWILETNVICYSSPMSADLRHNHHAGGSDRGEKIFLYLLQEISPRVLIVHGSGAVSNLSKVLGAKLPAPPAAPDQLSSVKVEGFEVVVIPSLAPPAFNKWSSWAPEHFKTVAKYVASRINN